jgi:hypothetical protein
MLTLSRIDAIPAKAVVGELQLDCSSCSLHCVTLGTDAGVEHHLQAPRRQAVPMVVMMHYKVHLFVLTKV